MIVASRHSSPAKAAKGTATRSQQYASTAIARKVSGHSPSHSNTHSQCTPCGGRGQLMTANPLDHTGNWYSTSTLAQRRTENEMKEHHTEQTTAPATSVYRLTKTEVIVAFRMYWLKTTCSEPPRGAYSAGPICDEERDCRGGEIVEVRITHPLVRQPPPPEGG
jgi:hypothetical protein